MTAIGLDRLHPKAAGLRLYRNTQAGMLIGCELVMFDAGRPVVDMILRRAAISGVVEVEPFDGGADYFADVYSAPENLEQTVRLDRGSYSALKNRWMRCRVESS